MAVDLTGIYNSAREVLPDKGMFAYMLGKQDVYKVPVPTPKMDYFDRIWMFSPTTIRKYGPRQDQEDGEHVFQLGRKRESPILYGRASYS